MFKKNLVAIAIASSVLIGGAQAFAQSTSLSDLEAYHQAKLVITEPGKKFDQGHWAYKSLQHLTKKYGLLIGDESKLSGNRALTRNEAAVILVNLVGKIEKDKVALPDGDDTQLTIMKNEFSSELAALTGRVARVETDVDALQGSVGKLESDYKKAFTNYYGEDFKIGGLLQLGYNGIFDEGNAGAAPNFKVNLSEFRFSGKLQDHLYYMASFIQSRTFTSTGILGDIYVKTDILPHHNLYLGQTRITLGHEGTMSSSALPFIARAQISRNFSNHRDAGIKVVGNYKFFDYYAGLYNGSSYQTTDANRDVAGGGFVYYKPFANHENLGKLRIGGGAYRQETNAEYTSEDYGFFTDYKIGKFAVNTEFGRKRGYGSRHVKALGFYSTLFYDLTDKIQLLARYDAFDKDRGIDGNSTIEYTLGSNYFMRGKSIKFQVNGTYLIDEADKDSLRLGLLSQFMF